MTVYELIQALAQYKPRTEVIFHVNAEFEADCEAEIDGIERDVTIAAEFDDKVELDEIQDNEWPSHGTPNIVIKLKY